jgi:hypothetical protein
MAPERDAAMSAVERAHDRADDAFRRLEQVAASPSSRKAVAEARDALAALLHDANVERAA